MALTGLLPLLTQHVAVETTVQYVPINGGTPLSNVPTVKFPAKYLSQSVGQGANEYDADDTAFVFNAADLSTLPARHNGPTGRPLKDDYIYDGTVPRYLVISTEFYPYRANDASPKSFWIVVCQRAHG